MQLDRVLSPYALKRLLGLSFHKYERLKRQGAPLRDDGKVDVAAFVKFWIETEVKASGSPSAISYDLAKAKDKAMRAEVRGIEFNKLAGKLVDAEDARAVVRELLKTARERLTAVTVGGLSPDAEAMLRQALIDATEGLSAEKAEGIGKPQPAFRH